MSAISPVLLFAASLAINVAETLPNFDVERNCQVDINAMGSPRYQGVPQCVAEERSAQAEIEKQWADFPAELRDRCISETQIGGSPSYVDVLECLRFGASQKPE